MIKKTNIIFICMIVIIETIFSVAMFKMQIKSSLYKIEYMQISILMILLATLGFSLLNTKTQVLFTRIVNCTIIIGMSYQQYFVINSILGDDFINGVESPTEFLYKSANAFKVSISILIAFDPILYLNEPLMILLFTLLTTFGYESYAKILLKINYIDVGDFLKIFVYGSNVGLCLIIVIFCRQSQVIIKIYKNTKKCNLTKFLNTFALVIVWCILPFTNYIINLNDDLYLMSISVVTNICFSLPFGIIISICICFEEGKYGSDVLVKNVISVCIVSGICANVITKPFVAMSIGIITGILQTNIIILTSNFDITKSSLTLSKVANFLHFDHFLYLLAAFQGITWNLIFSAVENQNLKSISRQKMLLLINNDAGTTTLAVFIGMVFSTSIGIILGVCYHCFKLTQQQLQQTDSDNFMIQIVGREYSRGHNQIANQILE